MAALTPEKRQRFEASKARRRSPEFGESFGALNVKPLSLSDDERNAIGFGIDPCATLDGFPISIDEAAVHREIRRAA